MAGESITIVPANRLGQLLAEARLGNGFDLAELADRSEGTFTVGELSDLEAGHRILDEQLIVDVTSLYEVGCGPIIPQRAELTIDLNKNVVSASGRALPLHDDARDHILDRYLSLVYVLRNREPGTEVPLRVEDLDILAASLAERSELIEEQLLGAMGVQTEAVNRLTAWFRDRLWVPSAGALVGVVSVGTLVMVGSDTLSALDKAGIVEPDQLGPLNLGRASGPSTAPRVPTSSPSTAADPAPNTATATTEIADAATLVAPANTTRGSSTESTAGSELGVTAESLLPFDWQQALPGWTVTYHGSDESFRGLTFPYDKSIEIYVRDTDTPVSIVGILSHELGHAIDVTYFGNSERGAWLDGRGASGTDWWPTAYANDFETGAGDFAEAFAQWAVGDPSSSQVAGTLSPAQLDLMGSLVSPYI